MTTGKPDDWDFEPARIPDHGILTPALDGHADVANALCAAATASKGSPEPVIALLRRVHDADTGGFPAPGRETLALWETLARVASIDLVAARTLEPHLDALAIIEQSSSPVSNGGAWGVYAAEGKTVRLEATADPQDPNGYRLTGTKPWCSLAASLDSALISAHVADGRRLFAVDLHHPGVTGEPVAWVSRGLAQVPSGPVAFVDVPARPVGEVGWYLDRPGFAWGGAGVAACWFGGAFGLYRDLVAAAGEREPDQLGHAWLGEAARLIRTGRAVLREAAAQIDVATFGWHDAVALRGTIDAICRRMLDLSAQSLGPAALTFDEAHARRAADLSIYLQQHHGARDDAELGKAVIDPRSWQPTAPLPEPTPRQQS